MVTHSIHLRHWTSSLCKQGFSRSNARQSLAGYMTLPCTQGTFPHDRSVFSVLPPPLLTPSAGNRLLPRCCASRRNSRCHPCWYITQARNDTRRPVQLQRAGPARPRKGSKQKRAQCTVPRHPIPSHSTIPSTLSPRSSSRRGALSL